MGKKWDYSELSKAAKKAGGPDAFKQYLSDSSRNEGYVEGRRKGFMEGAGFGFFIAAGAAWIGIKFKHMVRDDSEIGWT